MTIGTPPPSAPEPVVPATIEPATPSVPAGWYPDSNSGLNRWWDGQGWTETFQPAAPAAPVASSVGPMTAQSLKVNREVIYNREQKGHSLILHLLLGMFVLWIPAIYITVSPNHYWHA